MPRTITVELDQVAEAALKVLTIQGRSVDEAVHYALVATARGATDTSAPTDPSDVIGLA